VFPSDDDSLSYGQPKGAGGGITANAAYPIYLNEE
jgi:hypothetical protein